MHKYVVVVFAFGAAALAGCGLRFPGSTSGSRIQQVIFLSVGLPITPGPAPGTFQPTLAGFSYVFDNSDPENPAYLCQHTDDQMLVKAEETHVPLPETCQLPMTTDAQDDHAPTPPDDFAGGAGMTVSGPAGTNPLPMEQSMWMGASTGGCGVWATAMCNRRLGVMDPTHQVNQMEWDHLAGALMMDANGATNAQNRAAYYRSLGYCVLDKVFDGTTADYESVRDNLATCDIKIRMYRRAADGTDSLGHVETVISATDRNIVTNSWGHAAAIEGGTAGGFGHWKNGRRWTRPDGSITYPPSSSDVMVSYICPCDNPMMETLGQRVLRAFGVGH